jgi:hypothetical protein
VLLAPRHFALVASYFHDFFFIELISDLLAGCIPSDEVGARQSAGSFLLADGVEHFCSVKFLNLEQFGFSLGKTDAVGMWDQLLKNCGVFEDELTEEENGLLGQVVCALAVQLCLDGLNGGLTREIEYCRVGAIDESDDDQHKG